MLSVSFSLALVAAMLFGIVLPGHHKEVDKFNGQTRGPFPAGNNDLVSECRQFKVAKRQFSPIGVGVCNPVNPAGFPAGPEGETQFLRTGSRRRGRPARGFRSRPTSVGSGSRSSLR